jgi:hypothetical protein
MKNLFLLTLILSSSSLLAHDDHDWRQDYLGFLSTEYELPPLSSKSQLKAKGPRLQMDFFQEKLKILTSVPNRKSPENLNLTRSFLGREYQELGFEVSYQPFGGGINFIAEKKGVKNPQQVLILSSHIDSVKNRGANDDGTGTIGLLTVARELSLHDYDFTVRILGFDQEERGLRGSDAYVASLPNKENIIGNINFEMMGHNSRKDGAFHVIDCKKENSLFLSDAVRTAIQHQALNLTIVKACTDRSDHASFWRRKIPAIVISENFFGGDGDPCYHAKCDIMDERLDYQYMRNILSAVLEASEKILGQNNRTTHEL